MKLITIIDKQVEKITGHMPPSEMSTAIKYKNQQQISSHMETMIVSNDTYPCSSEIQRMIQETSVN